MTMRITHILNEESGEDAIRLLSVLLREINSRKVDQRVIAIGGQPDMLTIPDGIRLIHVSRRANQFLRLSRELELIVHPSASRQEVIHALGGSTALAIRSRSSLRAKVVTTITDPATTDQAWAWWAMDWTRKTGIDIVCSSNQIQKRLTEAGIPQSATIVIPPCTDSAAFHKIKGTVQRSELGLPPNGRLLLTASPPTRPGGQYYAVWATAILRQIWPETYLIVPGVSKEQDRLRRFIEKIYCPEIFFVTSNRYPPETLMAVADILLFPAISDVPVAWLAWAMTAGVPVVGTAIPSVADWITDNETGFLCKPGEPHHLAIRIREAYESGPLLDRCRKAASQQAETMFAPSRCTAAYLKVFTAMAEQM